MESVLTKELEDILIAEGYLSLKEIEGKIYGLYKFAFTIAIMVDIKLDSSGLSTYKYRYCYPYNKSLECMLALKVYTGIGDPMGGWVKQKGNGIDRVNPIYENDWIDSKPK